MYLSNHVCTFGLWKNGFVSRGQKRYGSLGLLIDGFRKNAHVLPSLKLTAKAPTNGWLEYYFPIGFRPIFRGYVSFREGNNQLGVLFKTMIYSTP